MARVSFVLFTLALVAACAQLKPSKDPDAPNQCYTEPGYLDSTNGCSERAGFPDCYLVCPNKGTRKKL
jgi:hypothetical protein